MTQRADWLDGLGRTLDRIALAVSPQWGAQRMALRDYSAKLAQMSSDADRSTSDRLYGSRWSYGRDSADNELETSLVDRRTKSRELYRDDSIGGVIDQDLDHVIGKGWCLQSKADPIDTAPEVTEAFRHQVENVLKVWSMSADRTGLQSLWMLTRLMWRTYRVDGECFAVLSAKSRPGVPIPLCIEIIDAERVDTPPGRVNDERVRMGVEYDASGDVIAYHVRRTHPFDSYRFSDEFDRIPVDRVIHFYDRWFPQQSRGFPWFTRVLKRLRDATDLDTAGIIAAQVQACFAAFVPSQSSSVLKAAEAASTATDGKHLFQDIRPGAIHYLSKDQQPPVFSTPTGQNSVGPLQELNHRRIATGMNHAYEMLMRDFRGLSFAGGRLVLNGSKKTVESHQQMVREQWFHRIFLRVVAESVMVGAVNLSPQLYARQPWFWGLHKATPPAWGYAITPKEEVDADIAEINACLTTLEDCVAKRGGDYEEVLIQRQKEIAQQQAAGIPAAAQQSPTSQHVPIRTQSDTEDGDE